MHPITSGADGRLASPSPPPLAPAADHLARALEAGEETPQALGTLARVLARTGERECAVGLLERSLAIDPRRLLQSVQAE